MPQCGMIAALYLYFALVDVDLYVSKGTAIVIIRNLIIIFLFLIWLLV